MWFYLNFVNFLLIIKFSNATNHCDDNLNFLRYYKIKSCHKSSIPMITWKNVPNLSACMAFTREKRGLAFNFSPPEARNLTKGYFKNCEVLECPEIDNNSTTLTMNLAYDYYSAFGNITRIENSTCIKSVGIFGLTNTKQNYTDSITQCQTIGGDLASILSETRTNSLSNYLKMAIQEWYQAAYVGLDDIEVEGTFQTSSGLFLTCTNYRAWAPGHPRSKHQSEDCVILDADKIWRAIKCDIELFALCEYFSEAPLEKLENVFRNVSCKHMRNRREKKKCKREKQLFEIYVSSSRVDQCALMFE